MTDSVDGLFIAKTRSERGNLTKRRKPGNHSHGPSVCTGHKHLFCMIMKAETMVHSTVLRCDLLEALLCGAVVRFDSGVKCRMLFKRGNHAVCISSLEL